MRTNLYVRVLSRLALALPLPLAPTAASFAQPPVADHAAPTHEPPGIDKAHRHAHPGVDLAHPIVGESPLPETHFKLRYEFADLAAGDGDREHTVAAEIEYALSQEFSIEAVLPYTFLDGGGDGVLASADHLSNAEVSFKLASYRWVDRDVLPAVGVSVVLPTGDEERGIGSDHVLELEPFARVGVWHEPFEFITGATLGVPVNRMGQERAEEDLVVAYHLSALYHAASSVQLLVEVHGESAFGDAADEHTVYVSPGLMIQPFHDKSISLGAGVSLPLTSDREFDYAINVVAFFHF